MIDITREIYEVSCIKTIVDSAKIMWLNENMKEGLDHRNLTIVVKKYSSKYRKYRYEIVDEPKNANKCNMFI